MQKKVDVNMKKAMSLDRIVITCGSMNELLVSWEQPTGNNICSVYSYCFFREKERW